MYLPGTVNERICDLRISKKLSQKELSEIIGVAPSQISRIENGEIQKISGDVLVKLAKLFGVSTDYILGLTAISTPKSYDISELGLSEDAVRALVTGVVDVQIVNRLIAHKTFPYLIHLINAYLSNNTTGGIMARNEIINMATATLSDFVKANPEHRAEVQNDARFLKSKKMGDNEADTEKIKSTVMAILKDIKKDLEVGEAPADPATAEIFRQMREQLQTATQTPQRIQADDVAAMVMNMVGQATQLDDKSAELFEQLVKQVFTVNNGQEE